jgi:mannose-6-phosphate isomerase-like protein (cupin superfamily)
MKKYIVVTTIAISCFAAGLFASYSFAKKQKETGYILEHESDIGKNEPAPHNGNGTTTAYSFFNGAPESKLVFRKRVLHPGSEIGYHLQQADEIYYIVSGKGEMTMNNKAFTVQAGDAILTFPGSSHGLKQTGTADLVIIINYEKSND